MTVSHNLWSSEAECKPCTFCSEHIVFINFIHNCLHRYCKWFETWFIFGRTNWYHRSRHYYLTRICRLIVILKTQLWTGFFCNSDLILGRKWDICPKRVDKVCQGRKGQEIHDNASRNLNKIMSRNLDKIMSRNPQQ